MINLKILIITILTTPLFALQIQATEFQKPYESPRTERVNTFAFTRPPAVKYLGNDNFEITFSVKAFCDVTVSLIDATGKVVRHLGSGVLGSNAPAPFQKKSLQQKLYWDGKTDLEHYVKEPEKLRIHVALGLKPTFDKLLGDAGPKNLPGYVYGIAVDQRGAYVFYKGSGSHGHAGVKKFDLNGNYISSIVPPPANLPESKLNGWGFVEYEAGRKGIQEPNCNNTMAHDAFMLPHINGKSTADCQPAISGDRIFFCSPGKSVAGRIRSTLHWIRTDGSTDLKGLKGLPLCEGSHPIPRLATSPDGKWLYMILIGMGSGFIAESPPFVLRRSLSGNKKGAPFIGNPKKMGNDNNSLNGPKSLDVDAMGRIYVCDYHNARIQIFSPEGKYLKTLKVNRPHLIRVHQKSGAIYVIHKSRVHGKTIGRLSKFTSFDNLKEEFHQDHLTAACFALDSWSPKPRLWLAGSVSSVNTAGAFGGGPSVRIFEDDSKGLRTIVDFDAEAQKTAGKNYIGRFSAADTGGGNGGGQLVCDPTREEVYWNLRKVFNLKTGAYKGVAKIPAYKYDDASFDKRGYWHVHLNPGFDIPGVIRVDPSMRTYDKKQRRLTYKELPYDYGVGIPGRYCAPRTGALPVKDQQGAKYFQDGLGVNMRGDIAVNSNIYYVPKMEDHGRALAMENSQEKKKRHEGGQGMENKYLQFQRNVASAQKRGEEVYFIKRRPGYPLVGATIWTFESTGELRTENAVTIGRHIAGVQMDVEGKLYFITARTKMVNGKPFLSGARGTFGESGRSKRVPFTGTLIKTRGNNAAVLLSKAIVPMDPPPQRPKDLTVGWVKGAEWLYAGASPIVDFSCTCPTMRAHTDWYKRTFVCEVYRHSIGVVDTNGNLILHIGTYGNQDSWQGSKSKIPVGGDHIGLFIPRIISGTDNYICFQNWGEAIMVLKLEYHAEDTAPIKTK